MHAREDSGSHVPLVPDRTFRIDLFFFSGLAQVPCVRSARLLPLRGHPRVHQVPRARTNHGDTGHTVRFFHQKKLGIF